MSSKIYKISLILIVVVSECYWHFYLTHRQNSITEEEALRGEVHPEVEFFPLSTIQASNTKEIQIDEII